jgi:hypothetical protein
LDTSEGLRYIHETPFSMDEGARYRFVVRFRVNHNIITGLRFQNNVRKYSLSVKDEIVLGSYAPQSYTHEFVFPRHDWSVAPSGMVYRGKYSAECKVRFQMKGPLNDIYLSFIVDRFRQCRTLAVPIWIWYDTFTFIKTPHSERNRL